MAPQRSENIVKKLGTAEDLYNLPALAELVGQLFASDQSLRGDLAHLFLHFQSKSSVRKMSLAKLAKEFQEFQKEITKIYSEYSFEIHSELTIKKFVTRENNTFLDTRSYFNLILFLINEALKDSRTFFNHFLMQEVGEIKNLLAALHSEFLMELKTLEGLTQCVLNFRSLRLARKTVKHDLGGMLELGNYSPDALWEIVFNKTEVEGRNYKDKESRELRFVCYRYSTSGDLDRLVKTFLVIQSPGKIRDHFAFKNYFLSSTGQLRKSAGAVLNLGNNVTLMGSSRHQLGEIASLEEPYGKVIGPKIISLDASSLVNAVPIVPGQMMTTNEDGDVITCRTLCVKSNAVHSSEVSIGNVSIKNLNDELRKFTVFGEDYNIDESSERNIWEHILVKLKGSEQNGFSKVLTKRDFDIRNMW